MKMKKRFCTEKGFTLAELLVVIVVLAILGAIALPKFYPQQEKARVAEAVGILTTIRQGERAYHKESGLYVGIAYPGGTDVEWGRLGMDNPNDDKEYPNRFFDYSVTVQNNIEPEKSTFLAIATRRDMPTGSDDYNGDTIKLNQDGTWAGDHTFVPSN